MISVGAPSISRPLRLLDCEPGQPQSHDVGQDVAGVGKQRQRMREPTGATSTTRMARVSPKANRSGTAELIGQSEPPSPEEGHDSEGGPFASHSKASWRRPK